MDFCNSTFWNWNVFWNADVPKLSSCFRHSVLVIVPCAILWILSFISSIRECLRTSGRFRVRPGLTPWTKFTVTKLVLTSVLILCSSAEGIYIFSQHNLKPVLTAKVYYTSVMVCTFTFVLALYLQFKHNRERKLNSYALSTFWLLFSVCNLFSSPVLTAFGVKLEEMTDPFIYTFRMITIIALTAQTLLSFFSDPPNSVSWNPQLDEFMIEQQPLLSRLLFSWMTKIVWYGNRNEFGIDNLPVLERKMHAMHAYQRFQKKWCKKQRFLEISTEGNVTFIRRIIRYIRHLSLILAIYRSIWSWILITAAIELICSVLSVLPLILMDYIIQYTGNSEPAWHGYAYAASFFLIASLQTLLSVHNTNFLRNASFFVRPALSSAIYRKCLRLKNTSMGISDLSEIANLAAVEGPQASEWMWDAHQMWSRPLRIIFLFALLGSYIKSSDFGIVILIGSLTFITRLENKYHKSEEIRKKLEELRIKYMSDALKNMKTIKVGTWEPKIMNGINSERQDEVKVLKKMMFYAGSIFFLWTVTPYLITLGFLVGFVFKEKKDLKPNVAFVTLLISNLLVSNCQVMQETFSKEAKLFHNALQSRPFNQTCQTGHVVIYWTGRESFRKVIDFLLREQLDESVVDDEADIKNAIEINAGTFQWDKESHPTLQGVTFSVPRGCLVAVVGPEGAGKGALFSAIIGDMHSSVEGSVRIMKGTRLAYVGPDPWTLNANIRREILFGRLMDEERYEAILKLCGLHPDLQALPDGDLTKVEFRKTRLGEEQLQRVCLARALYQDADIYLLHEPLNYLSSQDRQQIFRHILGPNGLLKRKTRILSTHDLFILPECDKIFFMSGGRILESGSYQQLLDKKGDFAKWVKKTQEHSTGRRNDSTSIRAKICASSISEEVEDAEDDDEQKTEMHGSKLRTLWTYCRFASLPLTFLSFLGFAAYLCFEIGANVSLSLWSRDSDRGLVLNSVDSRGVGTYAFMILGQCMSLVIAFCSICFAFKRFAIYFYKSMVQSVFRAPIEFFATTLLNTILQRFGRDVSVVDIQIPDIMQTTVGVLVAVGGSFIAISIIHPFFLIVISVICILLFFLMRFYMICNRRFRALQYRTLQQVVNAIIDSIVAGSTIRAYRSQHEFANLHDELMDNHSRVVFASNQINRWFEIRLHFLAIIIVFAAAMFSVAYKSSLSAAQVGLTMFYAINVSNKLVRWVPFIATFIEDPMSSLQRIQEFSNSIIPEGFWTKEGSPFSTNNWPDRGGIVFQDYTVKRKQGNEFLLQDINAAILPGEKVAVVGGKGSGKSTLVYGLFRAAKPEYGTVFVDGIDISMLGLHDLRSKIAFIPKDYMKSKIYLDGLPNSTTLNDNISRAVLSSHGDILHLAVDNVVYRKQYSIRRNLDPLKEYSDDDLWRAIEMSHLTSYITSLEGGLDCIISKKEILSVGQKQQLSLARALLKNAKILVWDENPVYEDLETDELIRNIVTKELVDCTVITISHRLYTVKNYDRVIVMEDGRIVEEGKPADLVTNTQSSFRQLCKAVGLL